MPKRNSTREKRRTAEPTETELQRNQNGALRTSRLHKKQAIVDEGVFDRDDPDAFGLDLDFDDPPVQHVAARKTPEQVAAQQIPGDRQRRAHVEFKR